MRNALGLRANDSLKGKWSQYLDEAEEAMAGVGVDSTCPGVKKLLNRLLGMRVAMQNQIFSHFVALMEEKACGRYEERERELPFL